MKGNNYLAGNVPKRMAGYFLVMFLSLCLGLTLNYGLSVQGENVFRDIFRFNTLTPLIYVLFEGLLYIIGYVCLYARKKANFFYRFTCILSIAVFVIMLWICLFIFKDNFLAFCITIYSFITSLSLFLYFRLNDRQMVCVRFELLWPAIYVIAISAYMGFLLKEHQLCHYDGLDMIFPLLIALFYETFLFVSRIPESDSSQFPWGTFLIHAAAFAVLLVGSWKYPCFRTACFFLIFSGASIILEAIDVISRKKDDARTKKEYESAICCAIIVFLILGGTLLSLTVSIKLQWAVILFLTIQAYCIFLYLAWEHDYYTSSKIDLLKIIPFTVSVVLLCGTDLLGFELEDFLSDIFNLQQIISLPVDLTINSFTSLLPAIIEIIVFLWKNQNGKRDLSLGEYLGTYVKKIRNPKTAFSIQNIYIYLSIVLSLCFALFRYILWSSERVAKARILSYLLIFLSLFNFILWLVVHKNDEETKNEIQKGPDTL